MRLISKKASLSVLSKCSHSSHEIQRIILKCLAKINTATLTATLNKGVKARISVSSVTSLQCLNCNSIISQEKNLETKIYRQSSFKMDKLKKTIGWLNSGHFQLKLRNYVGLKNQCKVVFKSSHFNCKLKEIYKVSILKYKKHTVFSKCAGGLRLIERCFKSIAESD